MGAMLCDSTDVAGHLHYIYIHPPDASDAAMTTLLQRFLPCWRDRKNKKTQTFMHSRWGDMSITAPAEGSWNDMSAQTTSNRLGSDFPAGYTPELFIRGRGSGGMDSIALEHEKPRMRIRYILERLRLRTPEPEQSAPSALELQDTFTRQQEVNSKKSTSTTRSPPRAISTPTSREDLSIVNHSESRREETTSRAAGNGPREDSDQDSVVCPTEISDTNSIDTFPNVVARPTNQGDYHHHDYESMDKIYDGTFEPRPLPVGRGKLATRSSPGLASTAFMRSSSRNKRGSRETATTKTSASSQSSSPGLAATAFMRSSSLMRCQGSTETPSTSVTSSPIIAAQLKEKKKQKKNKKKKSEPELVGNQELVPSYEELFG